VMLPFSSHFWTTTNPTASQYQVNDTSRLATVISGVRVRSRSVSGWCRSGLLSEWGFDIRYEALRFFLLVVASFGHRIVTTATKWVMGTEPARVVGPLRFPAYPCSSNEEPTMLCDHCGDCYELLTDVRVLIFGAGQRMRTRSPG
jgi:hypothetical protein